MANSDTSNPGSDKEIFFEAMEKATTEERVAYLNAACGKDLRLRRRVEELLGKHFEPDHFMKAPAVFAEVRPDESPVSEGPGSCIGRYRLLQKIGEGGCGVVYMAQQEEPVRRRVALKVIKLGLDTKSVIARFDAERQALALMEHPNIARVLDAGTTGTGRPFFVMELVRGEKITDYCDADKLPTRDRLELFINVSKAIQHAHQKGIIHRDIKPSNILVTVNDGVPVPKVIDFGVAKATTGQRLTDLTVFTEFQQFIGTPAYMSPEQALMTSLDVDTRTDIYSLGVLLYELLTGKTPFNADEMLQAGLDEMRRTIREKEPLRPSTRLSTMLEGELTTAARHRRLEPPRLIHLLRGDLDWIVMKCLEKDRGRRYETANGLAMDIRRFLDNEPVTARPPSRLYRFRKLVRRNKLAVAAATAIGTALLIGLGLSTFMFLRERQARQRAIQAERDQVRLRERAELNERVLRVQLLLAQGKDSEAENVINRAPPNLAFVQAMLRVGFLHAVHSEWPEAASNFSAIIKLVPENHHAYHFLAPLLIQTQDLKGYQQLRRQILTRFGTTPDFLVAERMAKDCLILPPETTDLQTIERMIETALKAGPQHWAWTYFQNAKALIEYRQGQFAKALRTTQEVVKVPGDPRRSAQAYAVLAMAHFQLRENQAGRSALDNALEIEQSEFSKINTSYPDPDWNDQLVAKILINEAKMLLDQESDLSD